MAKKESFKILMSCLILFTTLAAGCGKNPTEPSGGNTVVLTLVDSESGWVSGRNGRSNWAQVGPAYVGDTGSNNGDRALLSFDISGIPPGSNIYWAELDFNGSKDSGWDRPASLGFGDLGCLRVYALDYGTLDRGDYEAPVGNELASYCSASELGAKKTEALKDAVQSKVGATRFQIRIQFDKETDNDSVTEELELASRLTVNY